VKRLGTVFVYTAACGVDDTWLMALDAIQLSERCRATSHY